MRRDSPQEGRCNCSPKPGGLEPGHVRTDRVFPAPPLAPLLRLRPAQEILPHKSEIDWFDPDKPAKADPESDWLLEIYEGRFVGGIYQSDEPPMFFGDLRDEGANFVAWLPLRRRVPGWGG